MAICFFLEDPEVMVLVGLLFWLLHSSTVPRVSPLEGWPQLLTCSNLGSLPSLSWAQFQQHQREGTWALPSSGHLPLEFWAFCGTIPLFYNILPPLSVKKMLSLIQNFLFSLPNAIFICWFFFKLVVFLSCFERAVSSCSGRLYVTSLLPQDLAFGQ